jgi:prepilin-type N-terminal cleavage/methylation domain-containing protein
MRTRLSSAAGGPRRRAFSFVEMMVATAVFALVISAVVYTNMVGMTLLDITRPKLEAETQCRRLLDRLAEDIASAKIVRIGDGDLATWAPVSEGAPRQGSAVQLCSTLDTNQFVLYFRDAGDQSLKRITNGSLTATLIAGAVTNNVVFTGEDQQGNILTNDVHNMAIGIDLEFSQIGDSGTPVGGASYFQSFGFRTHVSRRSL